MRHFLIFIMLLSATSIHSQNVDFHLDKVYSIGPKGTIDISTDDAQVVIIGSAREDVRVKIERNVKITGISWGGDDFEVEVTEEDGNLKIREYNDGSLMIAGSISEHYEILIEAPMYVALDVKSDDGDYSIKNINGDISLNIDDGDIDLSNCNGKSFHFRIDDGDITMDKAAGSLYVHADDSDIIIKNASFNNVDVTMDDGDLLLETSISDSGNYSLRGDDSSLEFVILSGGGDFNIFHDDSGIKASNTFSHIEENDDSTILKLKGGSAKIEIRSDDGSISLSTL